MLRKLLITAVIALALVSTISAEARAAQSTPPNDDCDSATPVTEGSFLGDLAGATADGGDDLCSCSDEPDVWYSFTAQEAGSLTIDTCGSEALSDVNTILSVHADCPGTPLNLLACDNDSALCSDHDSIVSVELTEAQTVFIRIGNFCTFVAAEFFLNLEFTPTFPSICNGDGGDQLGCTSCPCLNDAPLGTTGGCLNSFGEAARLIASGSASISLQAASTQDLRFSLTGLPPNQFAFLSSGDALAPLNMASPCHGLNSGVQSAAFDGLRCAALSFRRYGGRPSDMNGEVGVTNSAWGGEGLPLEGLAATSGFTAGQTRFFQAIIREDTLASCMRGFNTSQAIRVTFVN